MNGVWFKILTAVIYIVITGVIWTAGALMVDNLKKPYNEDLYDEAEVRLLYKYLSSWRLILGVILLISFGLIYYYLRPASTLKLVIFEQIAIAGITLLFNCVRVKNDVIW